MKKTIKAILSLPATITNFIGRLIEKLNKNNNTQ